MQLPDVNILLYAFSETAKRHERSAAWLEAARRARSQLVLVDQVLVSFVRIATHPRLPDAAPAHAAAEFVTALLESPSAVRHQSAAGSLAWFTALTHKLKLSGNDVGDAYLAGIALDLPATLVTADRGFARFPGLQVFDPTA